MNLMSKEEQTQYYHQPNEKKEVEKEGYVRKIQPYVKKNNATNNDPKVTLSEQKIEQILKKARNTYVLSLIEKGDTMTKEDLELLAEVQQHVEEEMKQVVEEAEVDNFICTMSKCYIEGCIVHTVLPTFQHYGKHKVGCHHSVSEMDERMKLGYEYYMKNTACSCVEVYERHICVVQSNGQTQVINE